MVHRNLNLNLWNCPYHRVGRLCSYVGIRRTRNTCQYKKISPNLRNGTLISLYNHIPFIFECFHDQKDSSRREKPARKYHTKYSQNGQIVFLSSSSFFRRASSTSTQSLIMVFARNSSISHRVVHLAIAFSQPPSLHQAAAAVHSITLHAIFSFVRMRDHLATNVKIAELEVSCAVVVYVFVLHKTRGKF